jgi:hypothetical protein
MTITVALSLAPAVLLGALLLIPVALVLLTALPILGVAGLPALFRVVTAARRTLACPPGLPLMSVHSRAIGACSTRRVASPPMAA